MNLDVLVVLVGMLCSSFLWFASPAEVPGHGTGLSGWGLPEVVAGLSLFRLVPLLRPGAIGCVFGSLL